ncbi:MAG: POTRA domain-containing protein [Tenuifilaceae bacterium]
MKFKFLVQNLHIHLKRNWPYTLIFVLFLSSCNITRNIPDDKYLLNKTSIKVSSEDIKSGDLETYLRQKPNKKIVGFKFHLRVFNTANPYKYKGIHRLLKTIGEEPVILDTFLTSDGSNNIKLYLQSKGYYQSVVKDTTFYNRKKADVLYEVDPKIPYLIRNIKYVIEDTTINKLVKEDTINSLIKFRQPLDRDVLQEERSRIQAFLQNKGYYFFNKDYITFTADTAVGNHNVDLIFNIKNRFKLLESGAKQTLNFLKYKVNKVYFYPNYDPRVMMIMEKSNSIDSVLYNNVIFIYPKDPGVELKTVDQANLIRPGSIYSDDIVQKTQDNLNSLRLFRMVNIYFTEEAIDTTKKSTEEDFLFFDDTAEKDSIPTGLLNCFIQLTSHTLQSYQAEFVGTNTTGAFGAEGNLNYQHKNLFRGAEVFDIKLRGLVETVQKTKSIANFDFKYSLELGGSIGLNFPRFLTPFSENQFIKKYSPRTQITASYNYQRRPDYTRTIASMLFGYSWKNSKFVTHGINPIELNVINISDTSFNGALNNNVYLMNSFKNQIITLSSYNFTFNNQNIQKNTSYTYLRLNIESSGNILEAFYSKYGTIADDGTYQIFETSFSQYVRGDINVSYHHIVDNNNSFVYRVFAGVGYPYGNSNALPFDKKYFSGGANGIRAWSARSLGPGSVKAPSSNYFNQTGDIKLEANLEYRFKIFWQLEGALFVDAGNIWAFNDENENAIFNPTTFYNQIALGTGTGFRANLGFLTVRFDFGLKVYDPIIPEEDPYIQKWVPIRGYTWDDWTFNFGIGYPF